jgi:hypothetical protein
MKQTYVWVCVADLKAQYICEVYGPCTEHMMAEVNTQLAEHPIRDLPENAAEVLCTVSLIVPGVPQEDIFDGVVYRPGFFECKPVRPFKMRRLEKVLIPR